MGKNILIVIVVIFLLLLGFYIIQNFTIPKGNISQIIQDLPSTQTISPTTENPLETIIAEGLDTPWGIDFLPDGSMLITERQGTVRLVGANGNLQNEPVARIAGAKEQGEGGLLGLALHPDFVKNNLVYFYYTYSSDGENTLNRVVRMKYENEKLTDEQIVIDKIPGASNHNGGRIKFGPNNYLYITTGDAQNPSLAQDKNSLAGKILRVTDEGKPAPGNPFGNLVYSYGHRNPQGIAWDENGNFWETEHGPSGGSLGTGNDEINFIDNGKNYGWPEIQGDQTREGMVMPIKNSTPQVVWAPAGAAFIGNSFFFGGLRGQSLYEAIVENNQITDFKEHFKGKYGRIREVILGPDNMLYITTSNRDGRGIPKPEDDRVIKINPAKP